MRQPRQAVGAVAMLAFSELIGRPVMVRAAVETLRAVLALAGTDANGVLAVLAEIL